MGSLSQWFYENFAEVFSHKKSNHFRFVSVEKIYFIDYVLIFESHYSPKKKHLNEFEWYALQRRIMARLIGRTF